MVAIVNATSAGARVNTKVPSQPAGTAPGTNATGRSQLSASPASTATAYAIGGRTITFALSVVVSAMAGPRMNGRRVGNQHNGRAYSKRGRGAIACLGGTNFARRMIITNYKCGISISFTVEELPALGERRVIRSPRRQARARFPAKYCRREGSSTCAAPCRQAAALARQNLIMDDGRERMGIVSSGDVEGDRRLLGDNAIPIHGCNCSDKNHNPDAPTC